MGKSVAEAINHLNYPDEKSRVYCRVKHEVLEWEKLECLQCPICAGSIQGMGVECFYVDLISRNNTMLALSVADPLQQKRYIADLTDKGLIPVDPFHNMGVDE